MEICFRKSYLRQKPVTISRIYNYYRCTLNTLEKSDFVSKDTKHYCDGYMTLHEFAIMDLQWHYEFSNCSAKIKHLLSG